MLVQVWNGYFRYNTIRTDIGIIFLIYSNKMTFFKNKCNLQVQKSLIRLLLNTLTLNGMRYQLDVSSVRIAYNFGEDNKVTLDSVLNTVCGISFLAILLCFQSNCLYMRL